ncbi:hypothetical protein Trihar35433_6069 [Trichoderma harzianum]|nr:hypothetical protein Trihar35433_6069 [Trichoderma harzianum]
MSTTLNFTTVFQYEEHTVTYGNSSDVKTIFYLAAGPLLGPLLIFMHGWPGISLEWYPQLQYFAALGFRVIAPDMPGYGRSTARHIISDYTQEQIVKGMLALLADTGRDQAIWIGHDQGANTLWTLANTQPQVVRAAAGISVPYNSLELGLVELLSSVNRQIYPIDRYPYGQWSYMVYDNTNYDNVTAWFDSDILGIMKLIHTLGSPDDVGKPAFTSDVVRDGGWLGGAPAPPKPEDTPDSAVHLIPPVFNAVVAAMENTTFGPGNAWFRNEAANRAFNLANNKNNLTLDIPVFFVNGYWDAICDTVTGNLADRMRRTCSDLTEVVINAGHWVNTDQPEKVNSAMERWIFEKVIDFWPGKALPTL